MSTLVIYSIIIILFIILALIIFNITKVSLLEKRFSNFTLSQSDLDNKSFLEKVSISFWNFIHLLSKSLGKSKILDALSKDYNKYIMISEANYKSSLDYMTIKILTTILSIIVSTILIVVNIIPNNLIILVLAIIFGFMLPDIIWSINYLNKCNKISNRLYQSIIIIDDSISKYNIYDCITKVIQELDGPIKDEYQKILIDLTYNINITDAYKRFYKRTKIKEIKTIYHILDINSDNLEESFNLIREEFDSTNEKNITTSNVKSIINILSYVFLLVPLIFVLLILIINPNYFRIIKDYVSGSIYLLLLILIYLLLVLYIRKIIRSEK